MVEAIIGSQFPDVVIPLIDEARDSIKIVVFDWRWYPDQPGNPVQKFNQALVRAVRRGVKVEAITNVTAIHGILEKQGIKARKFSTASIVHAKLLILDERNVVCGSHNYTQNAFTMNQEISVLLRECHASQYVRFYNSLLN